MVDSRRLPSPNDLLILLTVARLGRFNAVAEALGTTHTTISRRILALDRELGGRTLEGSPRGWELTELGRHAVAAAESIELNLAKLTSAISKSQGDLSGLVRLSTVDGFGTEFVTPALVRLQREHPDVNVEVFSATRRVNRNRSGVDLEVVAGWPGNESVRTVFLTNYYLRLYASPQYLESRGMPANLNEVRQHSFVSYVESALEVQEIGARALRLPDMKTTFQATSIFAQNEAVRQGAGIGLLANFMVNGRPGFVPVLHDVFQRQLPMWAAARSESLRSPVVEAVIMSIRREVAERQNVLID
ncbi:MAG TPA: LysR family transcriptional regulator [Microbacteriaceae bacterium]